MSEEMKFLEVKNLEVQYVLKEETVYAVNNVSFSLEKGKTLGLVGETGAGKTSIARAILRILPVPPSQVKGGEVYLEGRNLFEISEAEMCKVRGNQITMIFQDPMTALNPVMTVGKQIAEVIALHNEHLSSAQVRKKAEEMLELVGIPAERYDEYPHQFSGGMKQRVVIAIALACDPDLLLADEPTTALDVTIQAQVLDLIRNLRETKGTSLILITHDLGVVAEMCDYVAIVYAGEIVEYGTLEELFDNPQHPYTLGLFGSLPKVNSGEKRLSPITGLTPDPTNLPDGCKFHPRCPYATDACKTGSIENREIGAEHYCKCAVLPKLGGKA